MHAHLDQLLLLLDQLHLLLHQHQLLLQLLLRLMLSEDISAHASYVTHRPNWDMVVNKCVGGSISVQLLNLRRGQALGNDRAVLALVPVAFTARVAWRFYYVFRYANDFVVYVQIVLVWVHLSDVDLSRHWVLWLEVWMS